MGQQWSEERTAQTQEPRSWDCLVDYVFSDGEASSTVKNLRRSPSLSYSTGGRLSQYGAEVSAIEQSQVWSFRRKKRLLLVFTFTINTCTWSRIVNSVGLSHWGACQ